jgi:mycothiol synthase
MVTQMKSLETQNLGIPGLSFRHYQGEADLLPMMETISASKEADQIERADTLEEMRNTYRHLSNCDPSEDVLIAEIDGKIVAYSRLHWQDDEMLKQRIYNVFAFMRPEVRRQGIGWAMWKINEARILQIAAGHAHSYPKYFQSQANDKELGTNALLEKAGFQAVRHGFQMVRPDLENIPDLPLPAGMEVRPVRPEDYRKIWDAAIEAFRDHWGFVEPPEAEYQAYLGSRLFQPELWQGAWVGDEVAGMVRGYIDHAENAEYHRLRGWTEDISTGRPWRKQGLAHALIARSLKQLKERGMTEGALGVDTQNLSGALHLYESMGFRQVQRMTMYRKEIRE